MVGQLSLLSSSSVSPSSVRLLSDLPRFKYEIAKRQIIISLGPFTFTIKPTLLPSLSPTWHIIQSCFRCWDPLGPFICPVLTTSPIVREMEIEHPFQFLKDWLISLSSKVLNKCISIGYTHIGLTLTEHVLKVYEWYTIAPALQTGLRLLIVRSQSHKSWWNCWGRPCLGSSFSSPLLLIF